MDAIHKIYEGNRKFVETVPKERLLKLAPSQAPQVFWLGCSDSRVCPSLITQGKMGEIFVYRNVANQALHDDRALLAALDFAVEVLNINNFVVCGHSNCGGVKGAISGQAPHNAKVWLNDFRTWLSDYKIRRDDEQTEEFVTKENIKQQMIKLSKLEPIIKAQANPEFKLIGMYFDIGQGTLTPTHEIIKGKCHAI